jgi:hypothetical protein
LVESDDEDELVTDSAQITVPQYVFTITGATNDNKPLILASGDVAKFWARGAGLGEQVGGISVDDIQVRPSFASIHPSN